MKVEKSGLVGSLQKDTTMTLWQTFERQKLKNILSFLMKVKNKHGNLYATEREIPSQWNADYRRKHSIGVVLHMKNYLEKLACSYISLIRNKTIWVKNTQVKASREYTYSVRNKVVPVEERNHYQKLKSIRLPELQCEKHSTGEHEGRRCVLAWLWSALQRPGFQESIRQQHDLLTEGWAYGWFQTDSAA